MLAHQICKPTELEARHHEKEVSSIYTPTFLPRYQYHDTLHQSNTPENVSQAASNYVENNYWIACVYSLKYAKAMNIRTKGKFQDVIFCFTRKSSFSVFWKVLVLTKFLNGGGGFTPILCVLVKLPDIT